MSAVLTDQQRHTRLSELRGWSLVAERDAIRKRFAFKDFREAFAWMTRVAEVAEASDHHPEWTNVYRIVDVVLSTHSAGGLTAKDVELARAMDRLADSA
jgi:4a-hydroxytetrahydrobiopterin dehydratase